MTFGDWWWSTDFCARRSIYRDVAEAAWNASRKATLLEASEVYDKAAEEAVVNHAVLELKGMALNLKVRAEENEK